MSKLRLGLHAISILTISVGIIVFGVGAVLLRRLDDRAFGDLDVFYSAARRYGSITWTGGEVCLAGCLGLAVALQYRRGFRAGFISACIGLGTSIFGLFFFSIHNASGTAYFTLLAVAFGASLLFLLAALVKYVWHRRHLTAVRPG